MMLGADSGDGMALSGSLRGGSRPKALRGPDKVAALLLSLEKPVAARLLAKFDTAELRQVTRAAADLGAIPLTTLETLIEEFASLFSNGVDLVGSAGHAQQLLAGVVPPEQIADIMSDVLGNSNHSLWERLSEVTDTVFAGYLAKEHPQAAALILSKVTPGCAAKVMGLLPRELRNSVMRRMLSLKPVTEPPLRILEAAMQEDLLVNAARNTNSDSHSRIADIINKMERNHMEDVLQSLTEERPKEAEVLKGLLFTFDDIVNLSQKARSVLFDQVPTERVVLALKGTEAEFRELVLSSLAARAKRMVEAELTNGDAAPQRDVMKARRAIADLVLEMAEKGQIELHGSEEDGAMVK
jgi:flagellar motor switch protein FliG